MPRAEPVIRNERGVALALAIFALVLVGGIVGSNFFAGVLEQQSGRNVLFAAQAAEAAEGELWGAIMVLPTSGLRALPAGGFPRNLGMSFEYPGVLVERSVARLADNLFLIQSRATRRDTDGGPLATRALGLLAHLAPDSLSGSEVLVPIDQRAWLQLY